MEAVKKRTEEEQTKPQAVKLQRYTITPFKGDYKDWLPFWNQFTVEVDGSSISEISKFNYLMELVVGKPKEDILGLPHNEDGYQEAKRILEMTYGRNIKIHKALIKELESLSANMSIHKLKEVHKYYNKLSRIIRTLVAMKKLDTAQSFVHMLIDKLGLVKEALVQKDDKWEEWDLQQLAENLRRYTDRNPLPESGMMTLSSQNNPMKKRMNETNQDWRKRDRIMLASTQKSQRRPPGCMYCGLPNHGSADCLKVLDMAHRREILTNKRLCFNCTGFGHMASRCKSRGCSKCSGKHHTSICDVMPAEREIVETGSNTKPEMGKRPIVANTTIHATVMSKVNGIPARIMIDSGSGSSYICTSLLTQLKLKHMEKRIIEQMYGTVSRQVEICQVTVSSEVVGDFEMDLSCINGEMEVLTFLPNPRIRARKKRYGRFRCLNFGGENVKEDKLPIYIILSSSDFQRIRTTEPLVLGPNHNSDPGAEFTMLGWTLTGKTVGNGSEAEKGLF